jgi:hypothetical protein
MSGHVVMDKNLTPTTIISNAFNKDYTASQAVADLEKLMNEATLLELTHGPHYPRFIELQKLIPVQERLVKAKMDGNPVFDRLGSLKITPFQDD